MPNAIDELVEACQSGQTPRLIARLKSGWAVMGEIQVMPGYCLLVPDPVVANLNVLQGDLRTDFMRDMARLGDAVMAVTECVRINYEILGNLEPALHAHVIPRYSTEDEELRTQPIWLHDWDAAPRFDPEDEQHIGLRESIRQQLLILGEADHHGLGHHHK